MLAGVGSEYFGLKNILLARFSSKFAIDSTVRELGDGAIEVVRLKEISKQWNQRFWERPNGLVVVTTHRLLFHSKMKTLPMQTECLSFPLDMILDLHAARI